MHASYGDWRQLIPETEANASQVGFVDGFFLLQQNGFGTIGHDRQLGLYVAWHLPNDDIAFDGVEDYLNRDADPGQPLDVVDTRSPQVVVSWAHHFSDKLLAVGGYGRFETIGRWAITPVDAIYGVGFAGVQLATGREHGAARRRKAVRADGPAFDSRWTAPDDARHRFHRRSEDQPMSTRNGRRPLCETERLSFRHHVPFDRRAGHHHGQCRQRRRRHPHVLASRRAVRLLDALAAAAHHGRARRGTGDVRADGRGHRQGLSRPDSRELRREGNLLVPSPLRSWRHRQYRHGVRRGRVIGTDLRRLPARSQCRGLQDRAGGCRGNLRLHDGNARKREAGRADLLLFLLRLHRIHRQRVRRASRLARRLTPEHRTAYSGIEGLHHYDHRRHRNDDLALDAVLHPGRGRRKGYSRRTTTAIRASTS